MRKVQVAALVPVLPICTKLIVVRQDVKVISESEIYFSTGTWRQERVYILTRVTALYVTQ